MSKFLHITPWRVLSSTITYEDQWLRLRSDHCLTADGIHINPYHVIEYPDWVNVVALTHSDLRVVLNREYRHGRSEVLTGLVSGTIERIDADSGLDAGEAAARRELREETGYQGGRFDRILSSYPNPASHNNQVFSFLALDVEPGDTRSLDPNEQIDVILEDLSDVLMRLRRGELRMQAMHVAALWSAAVQIMAGDRVSGALRTLRAKLLALLEAS